MNKLFALMTAFIIKLLMIPSMSSLAEARLIVKETTKYYNVSGKDGQQVHSKFGKRGPWRMRRKHAIAATVRTFDFKNIKFAEKGKKCILTHVDIHLNLTYYFPRWVNKHRASKKAQQLWAKYSRALVRHENTHGKLFKATMRQFERELLKTTGKLSNDCTGMTALARSRLNSAYQQGEAKHEAFDRREKRSSAAIRKLERALIRVK